MGGATWYFVTGVWRARGESFKPYLSAYMFILSCFRRLPMSDGELLAPASLRILSAPDIHPVHPDCHPLLGLILDQHGRCPCQDLARRHHRTHHDDTTVRLKELHSTGVLPKGNRRVDVRLYDVRLRSSHRVRVRQRALAEVPKFHPRRRWWRRLWRSKAIYIYMYAATVFIPWEYFPSFLAQ